MAGKRMLHSDIVTDKKLHRVSEGAENMFYRLLANTDDYGRMLGDPVLLKGRIYPRRIEVSVSDIAHRLVELVRQGLLLFYEASDDLYVQFTNFEKRQTFRKDIRRREDYPAPPETTSQKAMNKLVTDTYRAVTDPGRAVTDAERAVTDPLRDDKGRFASTPDAEKDSEKPVTDSSGHVTDTERGVTDTERPVTHPGRKVKEREGKGSKVNRSLGGGGGSTDVQKGGPPPPPPAGPVSSKPSSSPPSSQTERSKREEIESLVSEYLERFPNSRVPAGSARKHITQATSCNLSTQEILEAILATSNRTSTGAEKIWEILDPMVRARSAASPPATPGASAGGTGAGPGKAKGLPTDVLADIAKQAAEGKK
jgi:hypothetical protein